MYKEHPFVSPKPKFCSAGFSHTLEHTWALDFVKYLGSPTEFRNVFVYLVLLKEC